MSEKGNHRKKELEDFLRYTQDKMSEEERNAFEKSLERDPFAAEALEGLSSISPEEAREELNSLRSEIKRRTVRSSETSRSTRTMWYRVAAAVAVLLAVTSVLFTVFNDRVGVLDRKVAESPEAELEEPLVEADMAKATEEPSEKAIPVRPVPEKQVVLPVEEYEEKTGPMAEEQITEQETIQLETLETESETPLPVEVKVDELAAREEAADRVVEEEMAVMDEEVAAPVAAQAAAQAVERPAVAKSMKRERVGQMQPAEAMDKEKRILSGQVISVEDEQPLPGVIVALKGSNTGTVTDLQGKFEIPIEDNPDNTLVAHFIGMETEEIPVEDKNDFLITLQPDEISLDEVVVIGKGTEGMAQPVGYSVNITDFDPDPEKSGYRAAEPVGGKKQFNEYIGNNMRLPEFPVDRSRAVVVLNFVVGLDGRPKQVFVLKSPGEAFSAEAMRLLKEGTDWQPAEIAGNKVEQPARIRIVFKKD